MSRDAPTEIDLFQDVLDKQLTDRNGENVGKADGLIVSASSGRVEAIEAGFPTLVRRLNARWGAKVERTAAGGKTPLLRSCRVAFREVLGFGLELKLDVDWKSSPLRAGERWLAERVVGRVPGGGEPPPRRERDARPPAPIPEDSGEIRLELALGRRVRAKNGRSVGRLEEVRARKEGADWIAREIRLGPAALLERVAAGTRLFGKRRPRGKAAAWSDIDLSDPRRPRLRIAASELRPLTEEEVLPPPRR